MKRLIFCFVVGVLIFALIAAIPLILSFRTISDLLVSPDTETRRSNRSTIFQDPACICRYDDSIRLSDGLTKVYSLSELHTYFSEHQFYTAASNGVEPQILRYSEINSKFPIEITRSNGYSVYRVKEGGYYYLFWNYTFEKDESDPNTQDRTWEPGESVDWGGIIVDPDPILFYSTFIPDTDKSFLCDFQYIHKNQNTAYDVRQLDPFCEFWLYPTGAVHQRWSFSYLGADQILRITYQYIIPEDKHISSKNDLSLRDMVVVESSIVDRSETPSFYAEIFAVDLPK